MTDATTSIFEQITTWVSSAFQSIFGDPSAWQVTVISNATLVLLLILRLNRITVPIMMNYFRQRQTKWINQVPTDVAKEMRADPEKRVILIKDNYNTFESQSNDDIVKQWAEKVEHNESMNDEDEQELYFHMRVRQEERLRMARRAQLIFPDSLARYYTFLSLVTTCILICLFVFTLFHFKTFDKLMFAGGLLLAGLTSEWDVLVPTKQHMPHWIQNIAERFTITHDSNDHYSERSEQLSV